MKKYIYYLIVGLCSIALPVYAEVKNHYDDAWLYIFASILSFPTMWLTAGCVALIQWILKYIYAIWEIIRELFSMFIIDTLKQKLGK